jgi:hypothetical protein
MVHPLVAFAVELAVFALHATTSPGLELRADPTPGKVLLSEVHPLSPLLFDPGPGSASPDGHTSPLLRGRVSSSLTSLCVLDRDPLYSVLLIRYADVDSRNAHATPASELAKTTQRRRAALPPGTAVIMAGVAILASGATALHPAAGALSTDVTTRYVPWQFPRAAVMFRMSRCIGMHVTRRVMLQGHWWEALPHRLILRA